MNNNALIGYTGFIGSSLTEQMQFAHLYNSKNIADIRGKHFDRVVSTGNSSLRWKVNQEPALDRENIERFIREIDTITADKFVLVSTIDVFKKPIGVTEESTPDADETNPYGANRLRLEQFVREKFPKHLIIRLPIVYGLSFKKNILFDALNNHEVHKIDTTAKLQFYNVAYLARDIETALAAGITTLNMATAPIVVGELFKEALGKEIANPPGKGLVYDMQTIHAKTFSKSGQYIYDRSEMMSDIAGFAKEYLKQ